MIGGLVCSVRHVQFSLITNMNSSILGRRCDAYGAFYICTIGFVHAACDKVPIVWCKT